MELNITEINRNKSNGNIKKPTICLNMIVKNEAAVIIKTLENIHKYIDIDYWVISDTGSTDSTQDIIKNFFYKKGIPGELVHHEWKNFGYNRSKALECAYGKTDYVFIFDADDSIYGDFKLPFYDNDKLYADRYMLKMGTGLEYLRPLLINNQKHWMFKGVLHEFLSNMEPVNEDQTILGNYYIDSGRTGNRSQNPTKYYDDAIILEKAYAEEMKLPDQGLSGRYAFYCGRSYKDAGKKYSDKAIEWYKISLTSNNWVQEKYYSALEIGIIYKEQNNTKESLHYWFKTLEYDIERMEGLIFIIDHFYQEGLHILVNALYHKFKNTKCKNINEKLFVIKNMYNDRLEFFNGISAYYANDKQSGYECCKQVLLNQRIGENELNVTMNNFIFYIEEFIVNDNETLDLFYAVDNIIARHDTISHNQNALKVWNILFNHNQHKLTAFNASMVKKIHHVTSQGTAPDILLTFTTCKRLDLFKKTVNSILNHWTDCERIKYWLCVDDNSSEEERNEMRKTYDWINYYMKTPEEKGHRSSMNIIWNKLSELTPTYWIHIEDDFLFYHKTDYITQSITAFQELQNNPDTLSVSQILFNRNYAETIENYTIDGHVETSIPTIVLHNHHVHNNKNNYPNAHYWPHYSFRPSIIHVSSILKLGNYDSPNQFFEKDYADKWNQAKYKSAFFNRITCRHIGRLTKDRNNTDADENAYQLNKENQFMNNANVESNENVENTNMVTYKPIKIVNLERRCDRKQKMIELMEQHEILPNKYEFIKAIDGTELIPSEYIRRLFEGNDFGSRQGVIGCALSHLNLWRELINDDSNPEDNYYIIFEDDIKITHGMKNRLIELEPEMKEREILFFGYSMFENKRKEVSTIYNTIDTMEISSTSSAIKINELNKDLYMGGTFSYSINKVGAQKLIDYIEKNGIKHGIDYLIKINTNLSAFELQPQIVFSEWNEKDKDIDTDIQNNYNSLDFTSVIDDHFVFHPRVDQIKYDIDYIAIKNNNTESIRTCMIKALNDDNCSGFNTLGFFKNNIHTLTPSIYFGEKDGIYIKKKSELNNQNENTIRVKMLCNWCSSEQLCIEWSNMCNGKTYESILKNKWNTIEITSDDKNIDYYVIINHPLPSDENSYVPERTIIFQMEPWVNDATKNWGVKTWGKWASPDETQFLKIFTHRNYLNNVQWQIDSPFYNKEFNELLNCTYKRNKIAAISSFKNFDTGHMLRNDFIRYIENKSEPNIKGETNIEIDVFGRENFHHFKSYCGQIKDDNKYNVYSNYRYCLAVENNSENNYATEKIWEGILCESLCFYWGCPNLEGYIDPKAFVRLPLEDYDQAYKIIQQAIAEDWWSQRIEIIKETKQKLLHELGFFPLLEKTFNNNI